MRDVVFHLYTHNVVKSVMLEFVKPPSNLPKTLFLQQANDSGVYWKSQILQIPANGSVEYYYTVHYEKSTTVVHPNQESIKTTKGSLRETYKHHMRWGTNQYDVFQPWDKPHMQELFNGQFYFVELIYQQLVNAKLTVDVALQEYDLIAFGHAQFRYDERVKLYNWATNLSQETLDCYCSLFICYVLCTFYYQAGKCTVQGQYIVGEVADKLVYSMSTWDREEFDRRVQKGAQENAKEMIYVLVSDGTSRGWLTFCSWFCHLFDADFVLNITDYLAQTYKDVKLSDKGLDNCINTALSKLENLKNAVDTGRYVKYLVKRAQSVSILWRLYDWCQEKLPTLAKQEIKTFGKIFQKMIGPERHLRQQEVLDVQVWSRVPEALRDELADPFIKSVAERVPYVKTWNQERLHGLWKVMLDKKLQKCEDFSKILQHLAISSYKELNDFTFELLNTPKFAENWRTVDEDARRKFLDKLLGTKKGFQARADCKESKSKNKVLRTLKAVSAICETLQLTPCPPFVDSLYTRVVSDLQISDTADVIDAFVEVQELSQETKENYDRLLKFVINRDVENRSLLTTLKQLLASPGETSIEKSEVDALRMDR